MTTRPPSATTTLTARTPEDVLALVPVVLGFFPSESVVMLTFGAERTFHARVDLPRASDRVDEVREVVDSLLAPAVEHGVRQVLFVVYSGRSRPAAVVARALRNGFTGAGIDVVEALRTDGERWYPALGHRTGVPAWGVPYDVSSHPFVVRAVLDGRVTLGSREELRDSIAGDPVRIAGVVAALAELSGEPPADPAASVGPLVERHLAADTRPDDHEVARLLRGLLDDRGVVAAVRCMGQQISQAHVELWSDVVRRTPAPLVTAPAAVLAFAAWQSGHGALAWCALDRCDEAWAGDGESGAGLTALVRDALLNAVPPRRTEPA